MKHSLAKKTFHHEFVPDAGATADEAELGSGTLTECVLFLESSSASGVKPGNSVVDVGLGFAVLVEEGPSVENNNGASFSPNNVSLTSSNS